MPYICSIYETRPDLCVNYPTEDSEIIPDTCTFYFADGQRKGQCSVECNAACCRWPREGGEPLGHALPEEAGGLPCKYLEWVEEEELPDERRQSLISEREKAT